MKIPIRKSWGQNFIIDKNTINKIIQIINPKQDEHIIEIGPGKGAITLPLLDKVKKITAIEIDPLLTKYLNEKNKDKLNITNIDFMDWIPDFKTKKRIFGNLPYYVSSPIIFKLINEELFCEAIIMVQKELALRLVAKDNTKDYSRMSVMAQTFCDIEINMNISKNIFNPKPKVESNIVTLKKKKINLNFKAYEKFIKLSFQHKRKKIRNNLKNHIDKKGLDLLGDRRPENISVIEYIDIFNKYFF